jgi:hypothetical protein
VLTHIEIPLECVHSALLSTESAVSNGRQCHSALPWLAKAQSCSSTACSTTTTTAAEVTTADSTAAAAATAVAIGAAKGETAERVLHMLPVLYATAAAAAAAAPAAAATAVAIVAAVGCMSYC